MSRRIRRAGSPAGAEPRAPRRADPLRSRSASRSCRSSRACRRRATPATASSGLAGGPQREPSSHLSVHPADPVAPDVHRVTLGSEHPVAHQSVLSNGSIRPRSSRPQPRWGRHGRATQVTCPARGTLPAPLDPTHRPRVRSGRGCMRRAAASRDQPGRACRSPAADDGRPRTTNGGVPAIRRIEAPTDEFGRRGVPWRGAPRRRRGQESVQ